MSIANIKSLHYDAHVKYHRRASGSAVKMKYFLTHNERRALVEEVGVSCLDIWTQKGVRMNGIAEIISFPFTLSR